MAQTSEKLIDTNILVDYLRLFSGAKDFLEPLQRRYISVVTAMEIIQGSRNKKELEVNLSFLSNFKVVEIDGEISRLAMNLIRHYRLKHDPIIPDAFIAATAISKNKTLFTKNTKDFKFIKGLKIKIPY